MTAANAPYRSPEICLEHHLSRTPIFLEFHVHIWLKQVKQNYRDKRYVCPGVEWLGISQEWPRAFGNLENLSESKLHRRLATEIGCMFKVCECILIFLDRVILRIKCVALGSTWLT